MPTNDDTPAPAQDQYLLITECGPKHLEDVEEFSVRGSSVPSRPHTHDRSRTTSLHSWWFEVLGMATSASALLAIFGILFAYNGKPLSAWSAVLRPNTVVAVLSTLSKSAMLMVVGQCIGQLKWVHFKQRPRTLFGMEIFDEASRGPLGSAKLVFSLNWKAWLASIGGIVTVLSLAMDPFVQLVISYDAITSNHSSLVANISTARAYDTGCGMFIHATGDPQDLDSLASSIEPEGPRDADIAGAIYKGIFSSRYQSPCACASGDCSWTPFEALGICSSCVDVTASATTNCSPLWNEIEGETIGAEIESSYGCPYGDRPTIWNTTGGSMNGAHLEEKIAQDGTIAVIAAALFDAFSDPTGPNCETAEHAVGQSVLECTLKWCVKTYEGTAVQNNTLHDPPSSTQPLHFMDSETCDGASIGNSQVIRWESMGDRVNNTKYVTLSSAFKHDNIPEYSCPTSVVLDNFRESEEVANLAAGILQDPNAFLINAGNTYDIREAIAVIFGHGLTSEFKNGEDSAAQALAVAHEAGEFAELMDRVAKSMTNQIRAGPNVTQIAGEVHITEVRIIVKWQWMALPGTVVLFAIALLATSIVLSHGAERTVWKSSLLASLFHGLHGWTEEELDELRLSDMEYCAKRMRAGLRAGLSGHVRLVKVD